MESYTFSWAGLVGLALLLIPNLIWLKKKPENYSEKNENPILRLFEKIGQAAVTVSALFIRSQDILKVPRIVFFLFFIILMIMYEIWWMRYFRSARKLSDFYRSLFFVPVAGASLPVMAFFFLGLAGRNPLLIVSVLILGIGHIGIHMQHRSEFHSTDSSF